LYVKPDTTPDEIKKLIKQFVKNNGLDDNQEFDEIGMDSHFIKCLDMDMTTIEALKSVKRLIDVKINKIRENGKKSITE
jgi:hypothetical protein